MRLRVFIASVLLVVAVASACHGQEILANGSFESNLSSWTTYPLYPVSIQTNYQGVAPSDGSKYLALAGPATVGYTYARIISQVRSAPFTTGVPSDNFVVYLSASTYLHTNGGRNVSYALTLEPGYGQAGGLFHGGAQDSWVSAQTWGYYIAQDPFDSSLPIKPITVALELRDSLQAGEYLLLDNVQLSYGGPGIPEPSSLAALLAGLVFLIAKTRKGENAK